jgi:WhiB family redox-sensing transcriptional regulator
VSGQRRRMDRKGAGVHQTVHGPGLPPFAGDPRIACSPATTAEFFHVEDERGPTRTRREARAKAICYSCPLIVDCAEWALSERIVHGTWGALTEKERAKEIRRRDLIGWAPIGRAA